MYPGTTYQSRYLDPSSAVAPFFVYTSNTFCPPHDEVSGLSWYDRKPHSMLLVIGPIAIRRRDLSFLPLASPAALPPSTSVSISGGEPSPLGRSSRDGIGPTSTASLNLTFAVRI